MRLLKVDLPLSLLIIDIALMVGFGAGVFALFDVVALRPLPFPDSTNLVVLTGRSGGGSRMLSGPDIEDLRHQRAAFSNVGAYVDKVPVSLGEGRASETMGTFVDSQVFSVLGAKPRLGTLLTTNDGQQVVISERLWRRLGARGDIIGTPLAINGQTHVVIGVTSSVFFFPDGLTDLWLPIGEAGVTLADRSAPAANAVARLASGATVDTAQATVQALAGRLSTAYPESHAGASIAIQGLGALVGAASRPALLLAAGTLVLLLLVGLGNAVALAVAHLENRQPELSTKLVLGATPSTIVRDLVKQAAVVCVAACGLGVPLALAGFYGIESQNLADVPILRTEKFRAMPVVVALVLSSGLTALIWVFTLLRMRGSRLFVVSPSHVRGLRDRKAARGAWILVSVQLAATLGLGVMATVFVRSFARLTAIEWGFVPERVAFAELQQQSAEWPTVEAQVADVESALDTLAAGGDVESAAIGSGIPIRWGAWAPTIIRVDGRVLGVDKTIARWNVSRGYFNTLGIPIVQGREFSREDDQGADRVLVISAGLARQLCGATPCLGKRLDILEPRMSDASVVQRLRRRDRSVYSDPLAWDVTSRNGWGIVGVVPDVKMFGVSADQPLAMFVEYRQQIRRSYAGPYLRPFVVVRYRDARMRDAIRAEVFRSLPHARLRDAGTLSSVVSRATGGLGTAKLMQLVTTSASLIALVLSVCGVYGTIATLMRRRESEFAIRVAFGASPRRIVSSALRPVFVLILFATALGLGLIWLATGLLKPFVFGLEVLDPVTIAAPTIALTLAVFLACVRPIWRASTIDPSRLLRSDA